MEKPTRRRFLKMAFATATAAIAAACQPQTEQKAEQPAVVKETVIQVRDKVHLTWYDWGDINDKQVGDKTIADFVAENPEVEIEYQGTPSDYYGKLQTILASGVNPDIMMFQSWRWQTYALKNVLLPLDELRERDQYDLPWKTSWEKYWETQNWYRGKLYTSPWSVAPMVMFYIKKPFDDQGLPYPTDDWTFEEFVETCKKLTYEKDGTKYYGYQTNISYERLACWMRLNGKKEWDTENEPKKATWDDPSITEALQWQCSDCINTLKVSPTPDALASGAGIQQGNVAIKMEGAWFLPQMEGPKAAVEGGTPYGVVLMPKGSTGEPRHMGFGVVLGLHANTKHQDEAWAFLKFTTGEKAMKHVADSGRQPVTPDYMNKYWIPAAKRDYKLEHAEAFTKCLDTGVIHLLGMDEGPLGTKILVPAFEAMVTGQQTAQEIFATANAEIQVLVDEYWAKAGDA